MSIERSQQFYDQNDKHHAILVTNRALIQIKLIETSGTMREVDTSIISSSKCFVSGVHFESALQATAAL
jgi:hypothetical protein